MIEIKIDDIGKQVMSNNYGRGEIYTVTIKGGNRHISDVCVVFHTHMAHYDEYGKDKAGDTLSWAARENGRLVPCPFCGVSDRPTTFDNERFVVMSRKQCVSCTCGAQGPIGKTREEARNLWNKRG